MNQQNRFGKSKSLQNKKITMAWVLVTPALIIRGFTTIYPMIVTFRNSLFDIRLLRGPNSKFVGIANFVKIFSDAKLIMSIQFTAIFTFFSVLFLVILGTSLAFLLNAQFKGRKFLRTIVLIPWAMPMVVVGIAARWAFNDSFGMINDLIRRFSSSFHMDWLMGSSTARIAVISVDLWKNVPYFAILCLAALQFVSDDIYEAARIDGANWFQILMRITLPCLMKTILTLTVFFSIWRITSYDIVYAMTSGGPANSTSLIAYRIMIESFTNLNVGYAAAIAVVLFLVMVFISRIGMGIVEKLDV